MILKIGEKELNVKYAFEPTLKTRLLSRLAKVETKQENNASNLEGIEDMLMFLTDFLLVGLQKFHKDEYGFNYETGEGKEEQIEKMYALIEEYFDSNDDADALTLYQALSEEVLKNGIMKSQFQQELTKAKETLPSNVTEISREEATGK